MNRSPKNWRLFALMVCIGVSLLFSTVSKAQNLSGREFWLSFPAIGQDVAGEGPSFFIISDYCIDSGFIEMPAVNYKLKFSVAPGQYTQVTLPQSIAGQPFHHNQPNVKQKKGIKITAPFPITVYAVAYQKLSVDGETVIPSSLLGNEYVGGLRSGIANGMARLTVTGTDNNTKVSIKYWNAAGTPKTDTVTLNLGETYQVATTRDVCAAEYYASCAALDGIHVSSDKPVAVMNSFDCGWGECGACDNLMAMPLPVANWGTNYALGQVIPRLNPALGNCAPSNANSGDWYQIIGKVGTVVTINNLAGTRTDTIKNFSWNNNANYGYGGIWGQNPVGTGVGNSNFGDCNMIINSNQPVQVLQYSKGWQTDNQNFTDPESMYIFPTSNWEPSYLIGSLKTTTTSNGYLVVVLNDVGTPLPSTTITQNGTNVGATGWTQIGSTTWKYKRISIIPSSTTQRFNSTSNYKFGVYSASSGTAESFAFQGGLGPILVATCPTCPIAEFTSVKSLCQGQTLAITDNSRDNDPSGASRIVKWIWKYGDGTEDSLNTRTNPNHVYNTPGTYTVSLAVTNNSISPCTQTYSYKVIVGAGPSVKAGADATICKGDTIRLGGSPVINGGKRPYTIAWAPAASLSSATDSTPVAKPTVTTEYILTVTDSIKCVGKDTVNITVLPRDSVYIMGPGTICVGDSYSFTVNINATGPQTYTLKLSNGTSTQTFTGLKDGSKIKVGPSVTTDYQVTGFSRDDNSPGCFKYSPAKVTVTVRSLPTASFSPGGSICKGSNYTIQVNLPTGGSYNFSFTDGTTTTSKTGYTQPTYTQAVSPANTTTYTLTNVEYSSAPACSVDPKNSITVQVVNKPNPGKGDTLILCQKGSAVDLNGRLINNPQPGTWSDQNASGILSGSTVNPTSNPGLQLGYYTYAYTVKGTSPCPDSSSAVVVNIVGPPSFTNVSDKANCDANLNFYTVNAEVTGGDPKTYTSPDGNITKQGNIYKFTGTVSYPTKSNYVIKVDDGNACGPANFTGYVNCGCATSAGKMSATPRDVCETVTVTVPTPTNSVVLGKDTMIYVLHRGNASTIISEAARSSTPTFSFTSGMQTGITYYISAVAGPNTGNGPDLSSECLSVAQGTPVTWHELPTLIFSKDQKICNGDNGQLNFNFTGSSPFGAMVNGTYYNNLKSADSIPLTPTETTIYQLDSIFDKYCRIASAPDQVTITVNNPPTLVPGSETTMCNNNATAYVFSFDITGGDSTSYSVVSGGGMINGQTYTYNMVSNGTAFTVSIDDTNSCGPLVVNYNYTCPCITGVGTLSSSKTSACEGDVVTVHPVTYTPDSDDDIRYILHPNSADPYDQPFTIQTDTTFSMAAGMNFGTTYYISAVVGNKQANGNPDPADRCYQKSNALSVVFYKNPDATISVNPGEVCAGNNAVVSVSPNNFNASYDIEYMANGVAQTMRTVGPNFDFTVSPTVTTEYELTKITNKTTGCFSNVSSKSTIAVNPRPTLRFFATDTTVCEGEQARLNFEFTGSGPFKVTYTTSSGNKDLESNETVQNNVSVTTAFGRNVIYIVSFTDDKCPANIPDSVVIYKYKRPKGVTVTPAEICNGERLVIGFNFTVGTGPYDVKYKFNNVEQPLMSGINSGDTTGTNNYYIGEGAPNTFMITSITDLGTGCSNGNQASTQTIVHPLPTADLDGRETICFGDSSEVTAKLKGTAPFSIDLTSTDSPPLNERMSNLIAGDNKFYVTPNKVGNVYYFITEVRDKHCKNAGGTGTVITVKDAPVADFELVNYDGCAPLNVEFKNKSTSGESMNCVWHVDGLPDNNDCADFNYKFTEVGSYPVSLEVTTPTGCKGFKSGMTVEVHPIPIAEFDYNPEHPTMSHNDVNFVNLSTYGDTYLWVFDVLDSSTKKNPTYIFPNDEEATYIVKLVTTSAYGCVDSVDHKVTISGEMITFIPNSFTPNGDGVNDEFKPVMAGNSSDLKAYEISVYNRWGQQLFHSTDFNVGWDGYFNGTKSQNDVYIYRIRVRSKYDAEVKEYVGKVGIMK